jgi:hypothetical protein
MGDGYSRSDRKTLDYLVDEKYRVLANAKSYDKLVRDMDIGETPIFSDAVDSWWKVYVHLDRNAQYRRGMKIAAGKGDSPSPGALGVNFFAYQNATRIVEEFVDGKFGFLEGLGR